MDDFPLVTIPKKGKLIDPTKGKFSVQIEAKRSPKTVARFADCCTTGVPRASFHTGVSGRLGYAVDESLKCLAEWVLIFPLDGTGSLHHPPSSENALSKNSRIFIVVNDFKKVFNCSQMGSMNLLRIRSEESSQTS